MTSVPSTPTAFSSARITATGPPQTQPSALNEEWTIMTIPSFTSKPTQTRRQACSVTGSFMAPLSVAGSLPC